MSAPTRFGIVLDHHLPSTDHWPVVFIRDTPEEILGLTEYQRVWRWLPRHLYQARSTGTAVSLRHTPTGQLHAGKIYSFRYVGAA